MSDSTYATFLFSFGSVFIYEAKSKGLFGETSLYYWRYRDTSSYRGPFKSIMECTRDWEDSTRPVPQPDMTKVIKVDFIKKKRIT
jgi:hypothetical protein